MSSSGLSSHWLVTTTCSRETDLWAAADTRLIHTPVGHARYRLGSLGWEFLKLCSNVAFKRDCKKLFKPPVNYKCLSTQEWAPYTPYSISMPHWQSNMHTVALDFYSCFTLGPPLHLYVLPFVNFLTLSSLICLNCMWSENSKLMRDQVSQNRCFPPLISPPSSASLTVYTTVQQSKRLNQSCDRIWGRYFGRKQSITLALVCVCGHPGGVEGDRSGQLVNLRTGFSSFCNEMKGTYKCIFNVFAS